MDGNWRKKLAMLGAGIGLTVAGKFGIDHQRPRGHEPQSKDAGAEVRRVNSEKNARAAAEAQWREQQSKEKDAAEMQRVKKEIDAMFAQGQNDAPPAAEANSRDVGEALEMLEKASRLKGQFEQSIPGVKVELDGADMTLSFPDANGNSDPLETITLDLAGTDMVKIPSVTPYDSPIILPVGKSDDLAAVAEAAHAKLRLKMLKNEVTLGNMSFSEEGDEELRDFVKREGLPENKPQSEQ